MERNLDRGLDRRVETQKGDASGSKTPKADAVKRDAAKKLMDNFGRKK